MFKLSKSYNMSAFNISVKRKNKIKTSIFNISPVDTLDRLGLCRTDSERDPCSFCCRHKSPEAVAWICCPDCSYYLLCNICTINFCHMTNKSHLVQENFLNDLIGATFLSVCDCIWHWHLFFMKHKNDKARDKTLWPSSNIWEQH
jgi:hypothetical protein